MSESTHGKKAARVESGLLFRRIRRGGHVQEGGLTSRAIQTIIKVRVKAAKKDISVLVDGVSGHSLRVGSAQSLAAAGAGIAEMQAMGRWKSERMPGQYAKGQLAGRGAVARLRYGA